MTQKKTKPITAKKKSTPAKKVPASKKKVVKKATPTKAVAQPPKTQFIKSAELVESLVTNVTNVIHANDVKSKTARARMLDWFRKPK